MRACREEPPGQDLRQLQREALELAAAYRGLSAQLQGPQREQVLALYREEKAAGAALAGIRSLSGQGGEALKLWQPGREDARKVLERCYHRPRRCQVEYQARSASGEFGIVFEALATRAGERCLRITQLVGGML